MTDHERIIALEKQIKELQDLLVQLKYSGAGLLVLSNQVVFDKEGAVGFYGKTPTKQQTATDLATVITALKAYGLLAV
jgi:hypothetical protein